MKTVIEFDYEPVDYVTFIIYYHSYNERNTSLHFSYYFAV